MKASSRQVDGITVVDLGGRITLGEDGVLLRETVKGLMAQGHKQILLNLANVTYIDSGGLGELISAYASVRNAGGDIKLLQLTRKVHDLLQITKLCTVFDIWDDEVSAIQAFERAA